METKSGYSLRHAFRVSRDGRKTNQNMYTVPTNHEANIASVSAKGLCSQGKGFVQVHFLESRHW